MAMDGMEQPAAPAPDSPAPAAYDPSAPPSVFVFVPCYRGMISSATFLTSCSVLMALAREGIGGTVGALSSSDIADLRNLAASVWYDRIGTSHMLMIDADMGFSPELVLDMLALNEPVVGALYRHRREEVTWVGSGLPAAGLPEDRIRNGNFLEVEGVGGGATLIRRDAIAAMLARWPELSDGDLARNPSKDMMMKSGVTRLIRCFDNLVVPGRGRLSEDLSFCIRWRSVGGKVWANIGHEIEHLGETSYKGSFLQHRLEEQAREQFAGQGPTAASKPPQSLLLTPRSMNEVPVDAGGNVVPAASNGPAGGASAFTLVSEDAA